MTLRTAAAALFGAVTLLLLLHAQVKKGTYILNGEIHAYLRNRGWRRSRPSKPASFS